MDFEKKFKEECIKGEKVKDSPWPLKVFRSILRSENPYGNRISEIHHVYEFNELVNGNNLDSNWFSDSSLPRTKIHELVKNLQTEGKELYNLFGDGMLGVLKDGPTNGIDFTQPRNFSAGGIEATNRELASKQYVFKFFQIVKEESRLSLLYEDNLISKDEFTKGMKKCAYDVNRCGFNGLWRMLRTIPELEQHLTEISENLHPNMVPKIKVTYGKGRDISETEWAANPTRVAYINSEIDYINSKNYPIDKHEKEMESALRRAFPKSYAKAADDRISLTRNELSFYKKLKDDIEIPNDTLRKEIYSSNANECIAAGRHYIIKHCLPLSDPACVAEYPLLHNVHSTILETFHIIKTGGQEPFINPFINLKPTTQKPVFSEDGSIDSECAHLDPNSLEDESIKSKKNPGKNEPTNPSTNSADTSIPKQIPENKLTSAADEVLADTKKSLFSGKNIVIGMCLAGVGAIGYFVYRHTHENKATPSQNLSR